MEWNNNTRATRAWKLLLLLPRMLLFRPPRGGLVPRKKLEARFAQFQAGQWVQLLDEGTQCAQEAHSRNPVFGDIGSSHNPQKRPPQPREPLSQRIAQAEPSEQFQLDTDEFLVCLRKSRRGAAAGPSGMTSDHLFPLLESEADSQLFAHVGVLL